MSSGGGSTPAQTVQTSDPWSGAQPHLSNLYTSAGNIYNTDTGYLPYPGNLQQPLDPALLTGLQSEYSLGGSEPFGSSGVNAARNLGEQLINTQGLTPEQRGVAGNYGNVYTEASGQQNPYLLSQLAAQDRRIGDRVNSSMSGAGRYGSGAHTDVMARAMAEASYPVLAQDYANRQQTRLAALGGQQGIYAGGLENAGRWAQLMPGLDEARYAGTEHAQNIGKFLQDRSQQSLANQVAIWNAQQARPWEQLSRYANVLSGAGQIGGTKVTTANPYQPSTLARVGGGALAGAALGSSFGLPGAGIGAAGGGLLGLLG